VVRTSSDHTDRVTSVAFSPDGSKVLTGSWDRTAKLWDTVTGAVILTFTIMLVSANAVAMAVRERTREMAILRTLGFRRVEILQLVLGEAVTTSFVGGILGIALGFVLTQVIESIAAFLGLPTLQWQSALVVLAAALAVGFVASLVPALVAARKNIVESLRFTG